MDLMALRRGLLELITHTSGGDPIPAGCEIGIFTPTENENTHTVTHSLGEVPKFAVCLLVPNGSYSNVIQGSIVCENLASDPTTGVFDRTLGGGNKRDDVISITATSAAPSFQSTNTYSTYPAAMSSTEVTFATGRYYSGQFKANNTYVYILTK